MRFGVASLPSLSTNLSSKLAPGFLADGSKTSEETYQEKQHIKMFPEKIREKFFNHATAISKDRACSGMYKIFLSKEGVESEKRLSRKAV